MGGKGHRPRAEPLPGHHGPPRDPVRDPPLLSGPDRRGPQGFPRLDRGPGRIPARIGHPRRSARHRRDPAGDPRRPVLQEAAGEGLRNTHRRRARLHRHGHRFAPRRQGPSGEQDARTDDLPRRLPDRRRASVRPLARGEPERPHRVLGPGTGTRKIVGGELQPDDGGARDPRRRGAGTPKVPQGRGGFFDPRAGPRRHGSGRRRRISGDRLARPRGPIGQALVLLRLPLRDRRARSCAGMDISRASGWNEVDSSGSARRAPL